MRIVWLNKKNRDRVIIFFNGWGMDENAVIRLSGIYDLLMVYDYRHLENKNFPVLEEYQEIFVVAWSMGVWAASNVIPELPFSPSRLIALNGTEHPVDDHWGIPCRIYQLTEKGMDEKGRKNLYNGCWQIRKRFNVWGKIILKGFWLKCVKNWFVYGNKALGCTIDWIGIKSIFLKKILFSRLKIN